MRSKWKEAFDRGSAAWAGVKIQSRSDETGAVAHNIEATAAARSHVVDKSPPFISNNQSTRLQLHKHFLHATVFDRIIQGFLGNAVKMRRFIVIMEVDRFVAMKSAIGHLRFAQLFRQLFERGNKAVGTR